MSKLVVGNLKMNLTLNEITDYLDVVNKKINNSNVVICPTSIYIPYFLNNNYQVGLQNVYLYDFGAYTGEISAKQASSMKITYTILGHSERRLYFNESDALINEKVKSSLNNNLKVIICVGEKLEERNCSKDIIKNQVLKALENISNLDNVTLAYEPIWAIGTGLTPKNNEIEDMISYIKQLKPNIKVLYGGSVNEKNISKLNEISNIDGYLVGGASTKPNEFLKIIEVVLN